MSRSFLYRSAGGLILVLGLAAFAAGDSPPPTNQPVPKDQTANEGASVVRRLVYMVKHGTAKDLALVLAAGFKGDAEVQALPDPMANCLLISASPAVLEEMVKVLGQIDRRPQTAAVEIWILEMGTKKVNGEKAASAEEVDVKDFSGAVADVGARVDALEKKGAFVSVKRIRLTALEGQVASFMMGENKPSVSGITMVRTGAAARSITYRSMGVKAEASVRVSPEKVVTVDLKLQDSHAYTPEDGVLIGADENGKPVIATEFLETTATGKLEVPSGAARLAEGVKTNAKSGTTHTLVVVGARVIEPGEKSEK